MEIIRKWFLGGFGGKVALEQEIIYNNYKNAAPINIGTAFLISQISFLQQNHLDRAPLPMNLD